jgi:exosortase C (VPDSG-CTERM-specific)
VNTEKTVASRRLKTIQATHSPKPDRDQAAESLGSRRLIRFSVFVALLTAAFGRPLASLAHYATSTDLHSHTVLIPFVSAYLVFIRGRQLPRDYVFAPGWTAVLVIVGVGALLAAIGVLTLPLSDNDSLSFLALSFISLLAAGGFLFLGRSWMKTAAFPFAFLIFMVPLPDGIVHWLETAAKLASAEAAALFFKIAGMPVLRDGTVFQLPGISIEVVQECSGIRSTWVLFITGVLASYLFLRAPWRRLLLILFVLPLAILRNGFRILVIGWLCVEFGPQMIHSIIHKQGGPLFFALSLIPLFLVLWWLRRGEAPKAETSQNLNAEMPEGEVTIRDERPGL